LLNAVARRGLPNLIEATVIPAVMFFVVVKTINAPVAMAAVLVWAYVAILRRVVRAIPIPAILVLATLGLTVRTLVGLVSGSTFAYFIQPIATTVALAVLFLGSVVIGRPVIARLAHDFCPLARGGGSPGGAPAVRRADSALGRRTHRARGHHVRDVGQHASGDVRGVQDSDLPGSDHRRDRHHDPVGVARRAERAPGVRVRRALSGSFRSAPARVASFVGVYVTHFQLFMTRIAPMSEWSFLTNHARVLLCIARDPGIRLRDIAATLGITERTAFGVVADLTEAGYVIKERDGRRNRYEVQHHLPVGGTDE
jgi:hypothetical protein